MFLYEEGWQRIRKACVPRRGNSRCENKDFKGGKRCCSDGLVPGCIPTGHREVPRTWEGPGHGPENVDPMAELSSLPMDALEIEWVGWAPISLSQWGSSPPYPAVMDVAIRDRWQSPERQMGREEKPLPDCREREGQAWSKARHERFCPSCRFLSRGALPQ